MSDEPETQPTINTVLERIADFRQGMDDFRKSMDEFRKNTESRLEGIEIRFDRMAGLIHKTRYEFVEMRADLREWQKELRERTAARD